MQDTPEEIDVQIDINVSSYIPGDFIENSSQKIEIYQDIALCRTEQDIESVIDEIIDRYGRLPKEVQNLIEVARIKNIARQASITKIAQRDLSIVFYFDPSKFKMEMTDELIKKYPNRIKFSPAANPYITFKLKDDNILKGIKEFMT